MTAAGVNRVPRRRTEEPRLGSLDLRARGPRGRMEAPLTAEGLMEPMSSDLAGTRRAVGAAEGPIDLFRLDALAEAGDLSRLPKTVLILLENLLRRAGSRDVSDDDMRALAAWPGPAGDVAFMPGRVLMQDFTGVPAVVDLAAMRSAAERAGADPMTIEPSIPVDLVIDHSVQVDLFRTPEAYERNIEFEYRRNAERGSCCVGPSRRSTGCGSCPRAPASAIR